MTNIPRFISGGLIRILRIHIREIICSILIYNNIIRGSGGVGSTLLDSSQSLSSLARRVLAEICSEEWVLQKCLQNPDELYQPDMLLDSMLTPRQAQRYVLNLKYILRNSNDTYTETRSSENLCDFTAFRKYPLCFSVMSIGSYFLISKYWNRW